MVATGEGRVLQSDTSLWGPAASRPPSASSLQLPPSHRRESCCFCAPLCSGQACYLPSPCSARPCPWAGMWVTPPCGDGSRAPGAQPCAHVPSQAPAPCPHLPLWAPDAPAHGPKPYSPAPPTGAPETPGGRGRSSHGWTLVVNASWLPRGCIRAQIDTGRKALQMARWLLSQSPAPAHLTAISATRAAASRPRSHSRPPSQAPAQPCLGSIGLSGHSTPRASEEEGGPWAQAPPSPSDL